MAKDKYVIAFCKGTANLPIIIGKKKVRASAELVKFKKHIYPIDIKVPTYKRKSSFIYLYDIDDGQQKLMGNQQEFSKVLTDATFTDHIGQQLVAGLGKPSFTKDILLSIVCILMGLAFGYILGNALPLITTGGA
jgi:hypothetical protein